MTWASREVEEGKTGYLERMREVGSDLTFYQEGSVDFFSSLLLTSINSLISIYLIVVSVYLTYVLGSRIKMVNRRDGFTLWCLLSNRKGITFTEFDEVHSAIEEYKRGS